MIFTYISLLIIPFVIFFILIYGFFEKINVFDLFIQGVKDGINTVIELFPILLALFFAIGMFQNSGIINFLEKNLKPIINLLKIPVDVLPLILIRPISGSGAIVTATEIIKKVGVDNIVGIIASVIMGSTETTFYIYTLYTGSVNIKKTRGVLIAAICADVVGILSSIYVCQLLIK